MNKWCSWRKPMLGQLLPSPERHHSASSWVPLTWKAFWGEATVMGTLMYGAGHVWAGQAHFYLHDGELSRSPSDETFIHMLQQNCCLSGPHFPPPATVEALRDYVTHYCKVRRLHLIVVDLWRPWKYNTARAREITDQLWRISHGDDTHRVSPSRATSSLPSICIWICSGWLWISDLPGVASKGWAILYSFGNLHNWHASSQSWFLSPIGYGTLLWFLRTGG